MAEKKCGMSDIEGTKKKEKENLHKDHRSRMYNRVLESGFEHFEPHQVVEYLLFFPIPRVDTNLTAHRIINEFGGDLDRALNASHDELVRVNGVGGKTAEFFSLLRETDRLYVEDIEDGSERLKNRREILERLISFLKDEPEGTFCIMFFNNSVEPLDTVRYDRASFGFPEPDYKRIVKEAMDRGAASLATARKCSGKISFSGKERDAYRRLDYVLRRLDMCLVDHFAVTDADGKACFGQEYMDYEFFKEA